MTDPTFVAVLPAIDETLAFRCVDSMSFLLRDELLLVDNTRDGAIAAAYDHRVARTYTEHANIGVPAAWNMGIARAIDLDTVYLIVVSQSIRFAWGGADFLAELAHRRPKTIMHSQHGWKLLAIHHSVWEKVGLFDTVFSPAYREDIDYLYRMHLAGLPSPQYNDGRYDSVIIDADSEGDGMMIRRKVVDIDFGANTAAWMAKWGGEKLAEKFDHPYDRPDLDWTYVGPPPEGA